MDFKRGVNMKKMLLIFSVFCLVNLPSCKDLIVTEPESNLNVEDFEAAWRRIRDVYPYLEFKKIGILFTLFTAHLLRLRREMSFTWCFAIF